MDTLVNGGYSTVATAPSTPTAGTTLVVQAGDGAKFPQTGSFDVVLCPVGQLPLFSGTNANAEIARATVSTDTLTLVRAQYGTTAKSVAVGWAVNNTVTANLLSQLVAVSSASYAGKNAIINGGMDIWQRGTSFPPAAGLSYFADRWASYLVASSAVTISQVASGLDGFRYALRAQRNSGSASTNATNIYQPMETNNSIGFAGKTVTLSFWARAGANFSSASNDLTVKWFTGTGIDENVSLSYTGTVETDNTAVLTTSWQLFTYSFAIPSTATEMTPYFSYTPTGTAGANDYFDITGVQLELGSVATPFSRAGGSIGGELALCQRYCYEVGSNAETFMGYAYATNSAIYDVQFPVTMRTTPSATLTGTWESYGLNTAYVGTPATFTVTPSGCTLLAGTTITAGQGSRLLGGNAIFSAEL